MIIPVCDIEIAKRVKGYIHRVPKLRENAHAICKAKHSTSCDGCDETACI